MITPEIDDYIKRTLQIKEPVYFKKKRAFQTVTEIGGTTTGIQVNQDDNVLAILLVDFIVGWFNNVGEIDVREVTYAENGTRLLNMITTTTAGTYYFNNVYHLVMAENFTCRLTTGVGGNIPGVLNIGYIKISQKT